VRRALRVAATVTSLLAGDAARSWLRSLRTVTPAVGTMALMLGLAGVGLLGGLAAQEALRAEAGDASVLHVYLRSSATADDVAVLTQHLRADHRVLGVRYVSSEEALGLARQRPGMAELIEDAGANPFPASLDVRLRGLADVAPLAGDLAAMPAVDPTYPTSYDASAYRTLQSFVEIAGAITLAVVVVLAALSAVVTANAIRAAILARADDLAIMRLVGASGWMVRGPFVVEGALTGAAAGAAGACVLLAVFAGAQWASGQALTALLPGVGWSVAASCAGVVLLAGVGLGALSSLVGSRGLRC
jgi:cell division transport system permease protein